VGWGGVGESVGGEEVGGVGGGVSRWGGGRTVRRGVRGVHVSGWYYQDE
jgi:hypothetical protein